MKRACVFVDCEKFSRTPEHLFQADAIVSARATIDPGREHVLYIARPIVLIASYFGCTGLCERNGSQMNYDSGSRLRLDAGESIQRSEGRNAG
jgi:hypothetical protein